MRFVLQLVLVLLCSGLLAQAQTAAVTANSTSLSPNGGQLVLTASMTYPNRTDQVASFTVTNGGSGYDPTNPPTVTLTGGGGTGARASVPARLITNGKITDISLIDPGSGYTAAPTVIVAAPPGNGNLTATATASLASGPPSALAFTINVPPGWSLVSTGGSNVPTIGPSAGTTSPLEYSYTSVPAGSASFTATVAYPAGLTGGQTISGSLIYRQAGVTSEVMAAPLVLGATASATAPVITTQPVALAVPAGQTATFSVAATGSAPLAYQWLKDGQPLGGATNASLVLSNVTAAMAGSYYVVVSNSAGSVTSAGAALNVTGTAALAPQIITPPAAVTVAAGGSATFSVVAGGTAPLAYQWKKDGSNLPGATQSSLLLTAVTTANAGAYAVTVSNAAGAITSPSATLTVSGDTGAPRILTQPQPQSVAVGDSVTFTVAAAGAAPLGYQWRKDGVSLAGATLASLTLTTVPAAAAGEYSVVVTNSAGASMSATARLTVTSKPSRGTAGAYFGRLSTGGSFALLVRTDASIAFLTTGSMTTLLARDGSVDDAGKFRFAASPLVATTVPPPYIVEGTIGSAGAVSGTIATVGASLSSSAGATSGSFTPALYQAGGVGTSAIGYLIVGGAGDALLVTVVNGAADAARGTVAGDGAFDFTTDKGARATGVISPSSGILTFSVAGATGAPASFIGANNYARTEIEKLVNISTRSRVGAGSELIAGFVITGDQPKPVLVRAIGPSLAGFAVAGALPAARLEVFKGTTSLASGQDWGAAADASAIAATAARVGAFTLAPNSRDAALVLNLEPGAYTAVVSGAGGATGVALVEVYDATEGAIPRDQRIINISTRALAGAGDATLIVGFVVNGLVPKRVLVRGVGPSLTQFGVTGALADPRVGVYRGDTLLLENAGWSASPDAVAIADASAAVGAFALAANSRDAALIVNLSPGAYTAQVSSQGGASGSALLEIYEVP